MNKENAHLYLPLVQALADGKTIQFKCLLMETIPYNFDFKWKDIACNSEFKWTNAPDHYRIKPEPRTWEIYVGPSGEIIAGIIGITQINDNEITHENPIVFLCQKLERERDEAIRSCHIWQTGHAELVAERDYLLNLLQLNQPERKHIGRWGYNRQEFTSQYINNSKQ